MTRLKNVAILNREALSENTDAARTFRYVDIGSVDSIGKITGAEELSFGDAPSRARRLVKPGDSIVSTVRTYLRAIAYIEADADDLVVSTGFATVTPRRGVHPRFLFWAIRSNAFVEAVVARSVGVSYPAITATELGTLPMPLLTLGEQRRLADFLDAETARIDDLIAEQEGTRQLLRERVWSLFTERVLDSGAKQVPLRRVLSRLADGPFGSAFTSGDYSDGGAAVVRLGNIGFAEYRASDQAFIPLDLYRTFLQHQVKPGDLLIAGLGDVRNHAGRACVAPDLGPAMVKGKCFVATVDPQVASAEFLALYLSSALGRDAVGEAARGSTRTMINLEITKSSLVLLPSPAEQASIASVVAEARSKLVDLTGEIDRQLQFLHEHRQALITAAVTGGLEALQGVA